MTSDIEKAIKDPIRLAMVIGTLADEENTVINVYKIAKSFKIFIKYTVFESKQGGFYIPPEDEDDIHLVLINAEDSITRQRFSLAHEIAHMLRFQYNGVKTNTAKNRKEEETFCNKFAEHLLIPSHKLKRALVDFGDVPFIDFKDIHAISRKFGVSFSMMTGVLAYRENKIEGETDDQNLKRRIDLYLRSHKDDKKLYWNHILNLYRRAIDAYPFEYFDLDERRELKRINNYIFNELKNEGIDIPIDQLAEIITDVRMDKLGDIDAYPVDSIQKLTEAVGQYRLYCDLQNSEQCEDISLHEVKRFHKTLYELAPYKDDAGKFRRSNNFVNNGTLNTPDYTILDKTFMFLSKEFDKTFTNMESLSHSELIEHAVKAHYQLVCLHAFPDGNGRVSRAFMNRLLTCRNIPAIFFYNEEKRRYIKNLQNIDRYSNYTGLHVQVYKAIMYALAE